MCNLTPFRNWLIGIAAAIGAAIALLITAAILQGSWWTAWGSPILVGIAGGVLAGAAIMCGAAISALNTYCACAGAACTGACNNMRGVLTAAATVLGIMAAALLAASIFGVGTGAVMYIVLGGLIILLALIISAIAMLGSLTSCMTAPPMPPAPKPPPVGPVGAPGG